MVSVVPAGQVSVADLMERYGLEIAEMEVPEWTNLATPSDTALSDTEKHYLDRIKTNFTRLMRQPPLLENSVKMLVLSPLLDRVGFYDAPYRIESETSVELALEDEDTIIRGRIDVLVPQEQLWILVLESKRSDFAVNGAIGQALAYMLGSPNAGPTFGMITNGNDFLFLKLIQQPQPRYAHSKLFSLLNPGNDLYAVLQVLKRIGDAIRL
ncbi:MAG: restriction endonuclease subunit R [Elainellaceae cyanobacterium]